MDLPPSGAPHTSRCVMEVIFPVTICLLIAATLIGFSIHDWYVDQLCRSTWQDQQATIVSVEAVKDPFSKIGDDRFSGEVSYTFTHQGKRIDAVYRANRLSTSPAAALASMPTYKPGDVLTVKINPHDTTQSTILDVVPPFDAPMLVVGSIVGLIGVLLLMRGGKSDVEAGTSRFVNDRFMAVFISLLLSTMFGYGVWQFFQPIFFGTKVPAIVKAVHQVQTRGTQPMYALSVSYDYRLGGATYHGVSETGASNKLGEILFLEDKFTPGTSIDVRVDPQHPEKSSLGETNIPWLFIGGFIVTLGFLYLSAYSWIALFVSGMGT